MGSRRKAVQAADTAQATGAASEPRLPFDVATAKRRHTASERRTLRAESLLLPTGALINPTPPVRLKPRLAIYLRISQLVDDSVSIIRQYNECVEEVKRLGGTFDRETDVFFDVDVSASTGSYRDGMETLLRRIAIDKAYDGVVVWELPRALRSQVESLNLRQILMQSSCDLYIVSARDVSLWGPSSAFFDMYVMLAERESRTQGDRQKSRHRLLSIHGAARCIPVFGLKAVSTDRYIEGRATPIRMLAPDEDAREELGGLSRADLIRDLIDGFLEGRSLNSMATEWNREGYRSANGKLFTNSGLARTLESPSIGGLAHRGRRLLGADGEMLPPGSTEPPLHVGVGLVSSEKWLRIAGVIASRRRSPRGARESTLGSLLRCGRCGKPVSRQGAVYVCSDNRTGRLECGDMNTMKRHLIEPFVFAAAVEALKSRDQRRAAASLNGRRGRPESERLEAKIASLQKRLEDIEELWLATDLRDAAARERFARRRSDTEMQIAAVKSELTGLTSRARRDQITKLYADDRTVEEAFHAAPSHMQISILAELIDKIVLHPRTGPDTFQAERIEIVWATA